MRWLWFKISWYCWFFSGPNVASFLGKPYELHLAERQWWAREPKEGK